MEIDSALEIIHELEKLKTTHTRIGVEYYILCQENITIDKCIKIIKKHEIRARAA